MINRQQYVEYYTGGNDTAVQINGMIVKGWTVKSIIPEIDSSTSGSGFLVLFEKFAKTEDNDPVWDFENKKFI